MDYSCRDATFQSSCLQKFDQNKIDLFRYKDRYARASDVQAKAKDKATVY